MVDVTMNVNYTPVTVTLPEHDIKHKQKMATKTKKKKTNCRSFKRNFGLMVLGFVVLLSGCTSVVVWKTGLLDHMITRSLVLANDSKVFEMWASPPVQPLVGIYIFNYTNIEAFEKGREKLKVQEIGPYVYRQTLNKINVEFMANETVGFQQKKNYQFVPELSKGSLNDVVVTPNLALLGAVARVEDMDSFIARMSLAALIGGLGVKPFNKLVVSDYIWGYEDPLFDMARPLLNLQKALPFDRLGLMSGKNGTDPNHISVFTGETDLTMLGIIASFNGRDKQDLWEGDECNRIDGSEGSMFPPPLVQNGQTLNIYSHELCRRLPLEFQKAVITHELPAMRFAPPDDIFSSVNPNNTCYCKDGNCPPLGIFDASPCVFGGPAMISFPHFYQADPDLLDLIDGLRPNKTKHEFYLDVHERFGVILGGKSRMQLNILARKTSSYPSMKMFRQDYILPAAWFEVGVDDLPEFIKDDLRLATHTATHGLLYFLVTCFLLSSTILVYMIRNRIRKSSNVPRLYIKDAVLVPQISQVSNISQ